MKRGVQESSMSNRSIHRLDRVANLPVRRPGLTLCIAAIILLCAAWSASRLSFDPRLESLLPKDAASTDALSHLINDFHLLDEALILVEVPSRNSQVGPEQQEQDAARLEAYAQRLQKAIENDAEASRLVQSVQYKAGEEVRRFVENVIVPAAGLYVDDAAFAALLHRLSPPEIARQMQRNDTLISAGSPAADQLAKQILRDPLRLHDILIPALSVLRPGMNTWRDGETFLSASAQSLLLRISAKAPATDMTLTRDLMALLRRAAEAAMPGDLVLHYGGAYAIAQYSEQHIRANMTASITGTILLMQILFLLAYRRISSFPLVFVPVAGGVLLGFGIYSALFGTISPITAGIGAIIAGLGVDYSIHYLSHFESARSRGLTAEQAADIREGLGASLMHACATSAIGFLAIMASTIPAMRDFALLGALGLCGALVGTLTILPACLILLDRFRPVGQIKQVRFELQPLLRSLMNRKGLHFATSAMLLFLFTLIVVNWNASPWFASDMRAMHPQPNAPLETQDRVATQFGLSPESMFIHLKADTTQNLLNLSAKVNASISAASLDRFGVKACISPGSFIPDVARVEERKAALSRLDSEEVLASFRQAVDASLFSPQAFAGYEKYLESLINPAVIPSLSTLLAVPSLARMMLPISALDATTQSVTQAIAFVQLARPMKDHQERDALIDVLRSSLAHLPGAQLTGLSIVGRDIEQAVRDELPRISLVAIVLVIGWVSVLYRRVGLVLLAMAPVFCAALFVLAVLRVTGAGLNMINMAAIPILAGAAIDNGIVLVSAAHVGGVRRRTMSMLAALADRCHAMTLCSMTTIIGFGSLTLTSVPAIASLGLMLAAGMAGCWFASLFIVTPLLLRPAPFATGEGAHA